MKIALVIHELLVEGGCERQLISLAGALKANGHEITIFTSAYDRNNCFPQDCLELKIQEVGRGRARWLRRPFFLRGYLDMRRLAKVIDEPHEIWHPNHWPAQWGCVWLKKRLGGVVVWMSNDVPNFFEQSRLRGSVNQRLRAVVQRLFYLYDRHVNRQVDLTLLLSFWAQNEYRSIYPGLTRIVRPGMDPSRFSSSGRRSKIRARFGYSSEEFVLLWLGIFMPHRRLEDAIIAVSQLESRDLKVRLLLAGSETSYPEYVKSLRQLTSELHLENSITFAGKVADEEINDFYCSCDAFIFPNNHQTWGLAVLEAMACGRPVLVSKGAGVQDVLVDREHAMLFPPLDPKGIADAVEAIVSDGALRARIAQNGMELARKCFTWERFSSELVTAFQQTIDGRHEPRSPAR